MTNTMYKLNDESQHKFKICKTVEYGLKSRQL